MRSRLITILLRIFLFFLAKTCIKQKLNLDLPIVAKLKFVTSNTNPLCKYLKFRSV
jgi:hypothetical protein